VALGGIRVGNLIPSSAIFFIVIAFIMVVFLEYTYVGRNLYVAKGSREATHHAGIDINRSKFIGFLLMGAIAALAGIIIASMLGMGDLTVGGNFLFPAIIAAFLGTTFLREGVPNAPGIVVAAILLAIIANGLTMLGLSLFVKGMLQGGIFLYR